MAISSTSKMSVALGGITPGYPRSPYAKSGLHVSLAFSPTDILATPSSHPGKMKFLKEGWRERNRTMVFAEYVGFVA